jgi:hypothetical protein
MSLKYEKILAEDLNLGVGSVNVTNPAGGVMTGNKVNPFTLITPLTQTDINLIVPGTDLYLVYNSTTQKLNFYNGTSWTEVADGVL